MIFYIIKTENEKHFLKNSLLMAKESNYKELFTKRQFLNLLINIEERDLMNDSNVDNKDIPKRISPLEIFVSDDGNNNNNNYYTSTTTQSSGGDLLSKMLINDMDESVRPMEILNIVLIWTLSLTSDFNVEIIDAIDRIEPLNKSYVIALSKTYSAKSKFNSRRGSKKVEVLGDEGSPQGFVLVIGCTNEQLVSTKSQTCEGFIPTSKQLTITSNYSIMFTKGNVTTYFTQFFHKTNLIIKKNRNEKSFYGSLFISLLLVIPLSELTVLFLWK
ncbi:hypothetical protein Mgra_00005246 [Meloidogyne graminicola]|uniref:Uncharacterized protein n=1 Tax=Meloidogyne graminicola TaxID=189291 RepID=A0A8S9ZP09_9BILA|nr:hypothetical protein Mgra_00005246 [Meloidogyne graminicola]